jgi:hypothetical protein
MATEIPVTYQQTLFTFVWYTVEFIANLAVIYYVAFTVGLVKPPRLVKNDVPTAMNDTWSQTGSLLNNVVGIAKKVNTALNAAEEPQQQEEAEEEKTEKKPEPKPKPTASTKKGKGE